MQSPLAIGLKLRSRRKIRALSIVDVERATGVNRGQISRIERGDFVRVSKNVQIICQMFDVDPVNSVDDRAKAIGERVQELSRASPVVQEAFEAMILAFQQGEHRQ